MPTPPAHQTRPPTRLTFPSVGLGLGLGSCSPDGFAYNSDKQTKNNPTSRSVNNLSSGWIWTQTLEHLLPPKTPPSNVAEEFFATGFISNCDLDMFILEERNLDIPRVKLCS